MNTKDRATLIGLVFGDGSLRKNSKGYVELKITHTTKQLGYLQHKRDLLHSVFGGAPAKIRPGQTKLSNGKTYYNNEFSKMHKYFKQLRRWMYPGGIKTITTKILKYMDAQAFALLYMDDGCLVVNLNKEGNVSSFEVRIATHSTLEEALLLKEHFKETYDIDVKPYKTNKSKGYTIRMNTTNGRKFLDLTEKYAYVDMRYKWDTSSKTRARNISMYTR